MSHVQPDATKYLHLLSAPCRLAAQALALTPCPHIALAVNCSKAMHAQHRNRAASARVQAVGTTCPPLTPPPAPHHSSPARAPARSPTAPFPGLHCRADQRSVGFMHCWRQRSGEGGKQVRKQNDHAGMPPAWRKCSPSPAPLCKTSLPSAHQRCAAPGPSPASPSAAGSRPRLHTDARCRPLLVSCSARAKSGDGSGAASFLLGRHTARGRCNQLYRHHCT